MKFVFKRVMGLFIAVSFITFAPQVYAFDHHEEEEKPAEEKQKETCEEMVNRENMANGQDMTDKEIAKAVKKCQKKKKKKERPKCQPTGSRLQRC